MVSKENIIQRYPNKASAIATEDKNSQIANLQPWGRKIHALNGVVNKGDELGATVAMKAPSRFAIN